MILLLLACSEYVVVEPDPPAPAEPPGLDPDADFGQPPDWTTCTAGYHAQYYNLADGDPALAGDAAPTDPTTLDWWDPSRLAYRDFDGTLDLGANWWPVDEGLTGDPVGFTARWTAWVRAWSGGDVSVTLGSATDGWVILDGEVVGAQPGPHLFEPVTVTFSLPAGQYPLDVRAAQRGGDESAFRFRFLQGDVSVCYPDFSEE